MITLTEVASAKVKDFIKAQNRDDLALRVYVKPGGCSGFSFGMGLDEPREDDETTEINGIRVVVDPQSIPYVEGAVVDYKNTMMGGGFAITNPNAVSSCGCGSGGCGGDEDAEDPEGCGSGGCGSGGCGCH